MRRWLAVVLVVTLAACSSSKARKSADQAFLDQVAAQSKEQIMARADALAAKKNWEQARKYYSFLADTFPNDPLGRRAALRVADTFFALKDTEGYTEAELRYKDFANRFPSDPNRAYALLMLAKCSLAENRGPLRDLAPVHQATDSLKQVVQLFPTSPYAAEAKTLLAQCLDELAMHELLIARYYANVHAWVGAQQRLEFLFANYPDTPAAEQGKPLMDKVLRMINPAAKEAPTHTAAVSSREKH